MKIRLSSCFRGASLFGEPKNEHPLKQHLIYDPKWRYGTWLCLCSCIRFFATPWTVARQASLSLGFSSKNTRVGCHFLLPTQVGNLPNPGIEPQSPALAGGFFTTSPPGKPLWNMNSKELSIEGFWSKFKQPWAADFDVVRCTFWILAVKMRKIFSSFFFFGLCCTTCGTSVPWSGIELRLRQWKPGILTTRPPENSQKILSMNYSACF